jgi:hypothetical protein
MLELRPNCECCNKDLPPEAADAMICSFECTFCRDCTETTLGGRCANCGGELVARPIQAIGEEAPFLVGLKAPVGEAGEMQRGPEAIAAVGEIMSCRGSGRCGIDAAKHHLEIFCEDVRFVCGQGRS